MNKLIIFSLIESNNLTAFYGVFGGRTAKRIIIMNSAMSASVSLAMAASR
ncbi:hypothetical protein [Virgibacillus doumboii]|nr:hypothetical protein [Virgibacillus doumboii]